MSQESIESFTCLSRDDIVSRLKSFNIELFLLKSSLRCSLSCLAASLALHLFPFCCSVQLIEFQVFLLLETNIEKRTECLFFHLCLSWPTVFLRLKGEAKSRFMSFQLAWSFSLLFFFYFSLKSAHLIWNRQKESKEAASFFLFGSGWRQHLQERSTFIFRLLLQASASFLLVLFRIL